MISPKQKKILAFQYSSYDVIICDGAVRSGKTSIMFVAFIDWAMRNFSNMRFGICGKTVGSAVENIIKPYMSMAYAKNKYEIKWRRYDKIMEIKQGEHSNIFEVFGGKDESSYELIQGRTLAGVMLDEVVLMPESFVNQAIARCSVDGSKMWFSCNPASPSHWFYTEWIEQREAKNALYLRFAMTDNPSLSPKILARYESMYTGVFYDRYIKGLWVLAEGIIYPMYKEALAEPPDKKAEQYVLSIDYGTQNAFAAILWGKYGSVWYGMKEYYYSGRAKGKQKTDDEYGEDIDEFIKDIGGNGKIKTIIDPSAASFIALLRRKHTRYRVIPADNSVADGIRETATALQKGLIKISPNMVNWQTEAAGYCWDDSEVEDRPIKADDHLMDSMRYFVKTSKIAVLKNQNRPQLYL